MGQVSCECEQDGLVHLACLLGRTKAQLRLRALKSPGPYWMLVAGAVVEAEERLATVPGFRQGHRGPDLPGNLADALSDLELAVRCSRPGSVTDEWAAAKASVMEAIASARAVMWLEQQVSLL
jgi:hypothetical protein